MKRSLSLLAVAMVTASAAGCNCCPCLRGLCCWPSSNPCAPAPTYAAAPAACPPAPVCPPVATPAPAPVYAMPQQYTVPQYAAPQYAVAAPATPMFTEASCGTPYVTEMGCGCPYTAADPGCGYLGGYSVPSQQMMIDPSPAP